MGLFTSLGIGISGLQAQSTALDVISNNISNVSTTAYKGGNTSFADLISGGYSNSFSVNGNGSPNSNYYPSGVSATTGSQNSVNGQIASTTVSSNLAIGGSGLFAVSQTAASDSGSIVYSRDGSFTQDVNGNFVNTWGSFLQAWPLDPTTQALSTSLSATTVSASAGTAALKTVNVAKLNQTPVATTQVQVVANLTASQVTAPVKIAVKANLLSTQTAYSALPAYDPNSSTANMASGSIAPQFTSPMTIVDSKGVSHNVTIGYLKTGANQWAAEVYAQPASDVTGVNNGQIANGTIQFNTDGSLADVSTSLGTFSAAWKNGADTTNFAMNWGTDGTTNGMSQLTTPYATSAIKPLLYDPTKTTSDMAAGVFTPQFNNPISIVDSTGVTHNLQLSFLKTATNSWAVEVYAQPASDVTSVNNDGQVAAGTVTFNGDGTLASISSSLSQPIAVTWKNGAAASAINVNWGTAGPIFGTPGATTVGRTDGLSQYDATYSQAITANGTPAFSLTKVTIDGDGIVSATYANGTTQKLYKIPLANFADPNQLETETGGILKATLTSGQPDFLQAGTLNVADIQSGALESSNVDLSSQLTNMIIAQRAYQFNSKIVSTSDTMMQDLNSMGTT